MAGNSIADNFESMPLRFRVWDKLAKRFLCRRLPDGVSIEYSIFELPLEIDCLDGDEKRNFVISQDTGFKDKNGKEIFEGDIIKFWSILPWNGAMINERGIGHIRYEEGVFYVDSSSMVEPLLLCDVSDWSKELSVIGNIFETPELAEEEK